VIGEEHCGAGIRLKAIAHGGTRMARIGFTASVDGRTAAGAGHEGGRCALLARSQRCRWRVLPKHRSERLPVLARVRHPALPWAVPLMKRERTCCGIRRDGRF
jgi:hypothetical protein